MAAAIARSLAHVFNSSCLLSSTAKRINVRLKWKRIQYLCLSPNDFYCTDSGKTAKDKNAFRKDRHKRQNDKKRFPEETGDASGLYDDIIQSVTSLQQKDHNVQKKRQSGKHTKKYDLADSITSDFAAQGSPVISPDSVYQKMVVGRKNEALRSVLLRVPMETNEASARNTCTKYGKVKQMFRFQVRNSDRQNCYLLVEYNNKKAVNTLMKDLKIDADIPGAMYFPALMSSKQLKSTDSEQSDGPPPVVDQVDLNQLREEMENAESLREQIEILDKHCRMSEVGIRLRYHISRTVEQAIQTVYPAAKVCLNGSSASGLGLIGNDLDMSIQLPPHGIAQEVLPAIADTISDLLPIDDIERLFDSRVPLIKFVHGPTGIRCDLKLWDLTDIAAEMMYLLGALEPRFPILVKLVKLWAKHEGVTDDGITSLLRSYSYVMLVLVFLQNTQPPILPPLNRILIESEKREQLKFADINKLVKSENQEDLGSLFVLFLDFWRWFNFRDHILVPYSGEILKRNMGRRDPMIIVDPLNCNNNISGNAFYVSVSSTKKKFGGTSNHLKRTKNLKHSPHWGMLSYIGKPLCGGEAVTMEDHVTKSAWRKVVNQLGNKRKLSQNEHKKMENESLNRNNGENDKTDRKIKNVLIHNPEIVRKTLKKMVDEDLKILNSTDTDK